jgi:DNA-binding beta-propeller fold protein YncE
VINTSARTLVKTIQVGVDPVSVAVKPDGSEVWVSNHVSDSVSVIDSLLGSSSFLEVVETVQWLGPQGMTRFDEPVGIAFAEDGSKAFVALSSRNQIAVVDTASYAVTGTLSVRAQEPRALAVRNGKLYAAAFESGLGDVGRANFVFGSGVGDQPAPERMPPSSRSQPARAGEEHRDRRAAPGPGPVRLRRGHRRRALRR